MIRSAVDRRATVTFSTEWESVRLLILFARGTEQPTVLRSHATSFVVVLLPSLSSIRICCLQLERLEIQSKLSQRKKGDFAARTPLH